MARPKTKPKTENQTAAESLLGSLTQSSQAANPHQSADLVPVFHDFLGYIVEAFGGPRELAGELVETYRAAKEGSETKARVMLKIADLLLRNTQMRGEPDKVGEMTDEEIEQQLLALAFKDDDGAQHTTDQGSSPRESAPAA